MKHRRELFTTMSDKLWLGWLSEWKLCQRRMNIQRRSRISQIRDCHNSKQGAAIGPVMKLYDTYTHSSVVCFTILYHSVVIMIETHERIKRCDMKLKQTSIIASRKWTATFHTKHKRSQMLAFTCLFSCSRWNLCPATFQYGMVLHWQRKHARKMSDIF